MFALALGHSKLTRLLTPLHQTRHVSVPSAFMSSLPLPPRYIEPMLPTLVEASPEGDGWVHEIKYDGYRTQLAVDGADSRAFTRNGHDWSRRYGLLLADAATLRCKTA